MFFRQLLNDETACASYLFGCKWKGKFAVVDPHADLVDEYVALGAVLAPYWSGCPRSRQLGRVPRPSSACRR
jgi:hypothetical protein